MRRREFTGLVLGTAMAWPFASRAQQSGRVLLIGVLMGFAESDPIAQSMVAAFRSALPKLGWTEGSNLRIELRWAGPDPDRADALAKELAGLRPDAVLGQTTPVVRALAREMPNNPIVFVTVSDPIGSGFAVSLARPGGNITGFTVDDSALGGKWVELLMQIAPGTAHVALLFNPTGPPLQFFMPSIQAAASSSKVDVRVAAVSSKDEIEGAIAAQARDPGGGLIVMPNAFNTTNRELIIALANRYRVPAIYFSAYGAQSGGLIGYGSDYAEQARQAAVYVDRILKGTRPTDLPVQAPTKFELVINLKTAKALDLQPSANLLALADEVIE
jgi:putative tryptophan/tyrosine transport system substrate-binding protein